MTSPQQLLDEIDRTDRRMMALLDDLDGDQLAVPYERGINPPIWEVGHTAFFYEFFLLRRLYGSDSIMPGFDSVWDSFDIPHRERWTPGVVPGKAETLAYYREALDRTREHLAAEDPDRDEAFYLGQYVLAHQHMHLESLIWCRQTLGYPAPSFAGSWGQEEMTAPAPPRGDVTFAAGEFPIGLPRPEPDRKAAFFSFDNEQPGFPKRVEAFSISPTLVTNGEFLAFVEDGGYTRPDLWSFGGRYWLRHRNREAPAYWEKSDGAWTVRRFDQWHPLDPDAPVLHVSFWEAEAYCTWAGRRLPTEFEWEVAARGVEGRKFPWGDRMDPERADLDARYCGTAPAHALESGATPEGCLQMIGTAWEWTSSQYLPYDGFQVDMYAYMSTLQFGDHKTTRGGGTATSSSLIRSTYRQAYFPDRSDVFVGFRTCAVD